jgi:hypothetical protein
MIDQHIQAAEVRQGVLDHRLRRLQAGDVIARMVPDPETGNLGTLEEMNIPHVRQVHGRFRHEGGALYPERGCVGKASRLNTLVVPLNFRSAPYRWFGLRPITPIMYVTSPGEAHVIISEVDARETPTDM